MHLIESTKKYHLSKYNTEPEKFFSTSGRINILGEHIDYLGGTVLPMIISLGMCACVHVNQLNPKNTISIYNVNFDEYTDIKTIDYNQNETKNWTHYVQAVFDFYLKNQHLTHGLAITIHSDLPMGSGLSSSAAFIILISKIAIEYNKLNVDDTSLARNAQKIEQQYLGVNCGIMDPYAIALCKPKHLLQLDCKTQTYTHIPFELPQHKLVIIDSKVPRMLVKSAYNERVEECKMIEAYYGKPILELHVSEVMAGDLNEKLKQRAVHVLTEMSRVKLALNAIDDHDYSTLGKLMTATHQSLKTNYEVSCEQLDYIVETTTQQPGCLGARLMGAGFGGCCLALIENNKTSTVIEILTKKYLKEFGIEVKCYEV
jgi:galactokinase